MLVVHFQIKGIAAYSQSKMLDLKRNKGESYDQFEDRVWRLKAHVGPVQNGKTPVVIPAHGIHQMLVNGAQKGRLQPIAAKSAREGLANRLVTGIALQGDAETNLTLEEARCVSINAHSTGKRGSGTRVVRKFPEWGPGWIARFGVLLVDESLTEEDLLAAAESGGLVSGLGRFRPENMGHNGRFIVIKATTSELALGDMARQAA